MKFFLWKKQQQLQQRQHHHQQDGGGGQGHREVQAHEHTRKGPEVQGMIHTKRKQKINQAYIIICQIKERGFSMIVEKGKCKSSRSAADA